MGRGDVEFEFEIPGLASKTTYCHVSIFSSSDGGDVTLFGSTKNLLHPAGV